MVEQTALEWHGPFSWVSTAGISCIFDELLSVNSSSGVYLWTVPYRDAYLIYYVGETGKTFRERLRKEHDRFWVGCEWFHDPKLLEQGTKGEGPIYKPKNSKEACLSEFEDRYDELVPIIIRLLHLFHLFIAPAKTTLRKRIERALMWDVWDAGDPAWNIIANERWDPRKKEISIPMNSSVRFWGLGNALEA